MNQYNFIHKKTLNSNILNSYLTHAYVTNQYSNYGHATQILERRARSMLKVTDDKAVIAVNNGSSALHAIVLLIQKLEDNIDLVTQSFTFPCAIQGVCNHSRIVDFDSDLDIDISSIKSHEVVIVTNVFGHLQNLDKILGLPNKYIIFDNAATPYSFWKGINSINYGFASFISLHHTKTIGFGEGGLIIISKEYEQAIRSIISFDKDSYGKYTRQGNNYKISEISSAAILQWWDQFDINKLASLYVKRYEEYNIANFPHKADKTDTFLPNCVPVIFNKAVEIPDYPMYDVKKYYKPLDDSKIANDVYNRILCFPIGN
jgi:dTDP-4-amino-4,6-dideoxygalactose transaminase